MNRKEALQNVKRMIGFSDTFDESIFTLFPELKESESEDEIHREWILEYLYDGLQKSDEQVKGQFKSAIAWIENLGNIDIETYKNAEKEKSDFVGGGFIKCFANFLDFKEGENYWLEYVGKDNYNVRSDNLLGKTYHITPCQLYTVFKKLTCLEKQSERESKDKSKFKESEDEEIRKVLINIVKGACHKYGIKYIGDKISEEKLLSYLEKQKEQKSLNISAASEWLRKHVCTYMNSEYNEFHKCVEYDGSIDKERLVNDFEEAMQKEQKPTEWSEEDKALFELLHQCVCWCINDDRIIYSERERISKTMIPFIEKLQTLCPQPKNEWSKEDEANLNEALSYIKDDALKEFIKSLCSQAKQEQKEPSDKGEISDGYHTFNELYYYRLLYNAAFFNLLPKEWVHKSKRHHDGEECFGGGWFIVTANLPTGQISNHYEIKDWDLFHIPEKETADKWDGHTPQEAAKRLHKFLLEMPDLMPAEYLPKGKSMTL